jgi:hypothetical protein
VGELTLEITELDIVVIDQGELTDSGGRKIKRNWRSKPARTNHEHVGTEQGLLTSNIKLRQHDLTAVP